MNSERAILHSDLNSFYASVEVMDEKGKTEEVMKLLKAFSLEEGE